MYKLLLIALLVASPAAMANIQAEGNAFSPEKGLDLSASFAAQRTAILAALQDGKTYAEIAPDKRQEVRTSLDRIAGLLGDRSTVEQLPESNKVEVFNEQEKINTLLTQAREDSRLVCTREKKVGSHRATNNCMTVAERRRAHEDTQGALRRNMRVACVPGVSCAN